LLRFSAQWRLTILLFIGYEYEDGTIAFADVPVWLCQSIMPIGFGVMALRFFYAVFEQEQ